MLGFYFKFICFLFGALYAWTKKLIFNLLRYTDPQKYHKKLRIK